MHTKRVQSYAYCRQPNHTLLPHMSTMNPPKHSSSQAQLQRAYAVNAYNAHAAMHTVHRMHASFAAPATTCQQASLHGCLTVAVNAYNAHTCPYAYNMHVTLRLT
jgi:hypothetical protein